MEINIDTNKDDHKTITKAIEMLKTFLKCSEQVKQASTTDLIERPETITSSNKNDNQYKFFPQIHGQAKETIMMILEHVEIANVDEIEQRTDMPKESIRSVLAKLKKENLVDSSNERPKKYFLKDKGNVELKSMLKNSKVSFMG